MDAIGCVDADTCDCNVERTRFSILKGFPLGGFGNNGACVIARISAMKVGGVLVGDPVWNAKIKCPDGVHFKRDFGWLGEVSGRMREEILTLSPLVESKKKMPRTNGSS